MISNNTVSQQVVEGNNVDLKTPNKVLDFDFEKALSFLMDDEKVYSPMASYLSDEREKRINSLLETSKEPQPQRSGEDPTVNILKSILQSTEDSDTDFYNDQIPNTFETIDYRIEILKRVIGLLYSELDRKNVYSKEEKEMLAKTFLQVQNKIHDLEGIQNEMHGESDLLTSLITSLRTGYLEALHSEMNPIDAHKAYSIFDTHLTMFTSTFADTVEQKLLTLILTRKRKPCRN